MVNMVRNILGAIMAFFAYIIPVKKVKRTPIEQENINAQTKHYELYQFFACPFCIITRRTIRKLGLNIITRNAQGNTSYRKELLQEGGKIQVPCLKITKEDTTIWMYESSDIRKFLAHKYGDRCKKTL